MRTSYFLWVMAEAALLIFILEILLYQRYETVQYWPGRHSASLIRQSEFLTLFQDLLFVCCLEKGLERKLFPLTKKDKQEKDIDMVLCIRIVFCSVLGPQLTLVDLNQSCRRPRLICKLSSSPCTSISSPYSSFSLPSYNYPFGVILLKLIRFIGEVASA